MNGTVEVFGNIFEYDFLAAWIKYNRLVHDYTQEALCHGICSSSHLSYFENGKKKLDSGLIEALLKRLNIPNITLNDNIGLIRQKFINFISEIEFRNFEGAKYIFKDILASEHLIEVSPYVIEFKIHKLAYDIYIRNSDFSSLKKDFDELETIYHSLDDNLKYLFLLLSGRLYYKYISHEEGLARLEKAKELKDTPWINYHLGFSYCYDNQPLRSIISLKSALDSYHKLGHYVCAMYCNIYLGICYTDTKMYTESYTHLTAAFNAATNFNIPAVMNQSAFHISNMYMHLYKYSTVIEWASKSLTGPFSLIAACNCVESYEHLNEIDSYKEIFDKYLVPENQSSIYYNLLYFNYLRIYHNTEDIFLSETLNTIIPYYEEINYSNICNQIYLKLITHYESKRKYKEANKLYRKLLK